MGSWRTRHHPRALSVLDSAGGSGVIGALEPEDPHMAVTTWRGRGSLNPAGMRPCHYPPQRPPQPLPCFLSPLFSFQRHLLRVRGHLSSWHPMPSLILTGLVILGAEISGPFSPAPPPRPQGLVRLDSSGFLAPAAFPQLSTFALHVSSPQISSFTQSHCLAQVPFVVIPVLSALCTPGAIPRSSPFPSKPPPQNPASILSVFFLPFKVSWDFVPILAFI